MTTYVTCLERLLKFWGFPMKNHMISGIGVLAFAFTLSAVGVDPFTHQVQAAESKFDSKMQECAKVCSDCQRACDHCVMHGANLLAEG